MRILLLTFFLAATSMVFGQKTKPPFIKNRPEPARVVNDYGHFLSKPEVSYLEKELVAYWQRTGNALVIITLPSLTDARSGVEYSIEEVALLYFNKWGIGDKIKNNGVLVMLTQKPRSVRIATGKGLEDILTDADCLRIINNNLAPQFKNGLFFLGLKEGTEAIEQTLDKPRVAPAQAVVAPVVQQVSQAKSQTKPGFFSTLFWLSFLFGVLALFFMLIRKLFRLIKSGEWKNYSGGGYYSGRGYRRPHYHSTTNNFFSGGWGNSGRSSGSSSSSSSSSSSGSSSGSSYGGGSSSGGGASGSW